VTYFQRSEKAFGLTRTLADDSVDGLGDQSLTITAADTGAAGGTTGTWTASGFGGHANIMITMEVNGTHEFAGFLVNQSPGTSGTWTTANWTHCPFKRLAIWYNG
jgi:hypothetical protein